MRVMREVAEARMVRRVIPSHDARIDLHECVAILAHRLVEVQVEHLAAVKFDSPFADEVMHGNDEWTSRYEAGEGAIERSSHSRTLRMTWLRCRASTALRHSIESSQSGCSQPSPRARRVS